MKNIFKILFLLVFIFSIFIPLVNASSVNMDLVNNTTTNLPDNNIEYENTLGNAVNNITNTNLSSSSPSPVTRTVQSNDNFLNLENILSILIIVIGIILIFLGIAIIIRCK